LLRVSWDLYLVPAEHADDVDEWLEEAAEEGHDPNAALAHAEAARSARPELELGGPYGSDYQLTLPEESGLPLDIGLYGNHASISVAYWDLGARTNDVAAIVVDVVEVLSAGTGWVAYDPQEGRVVQTSELPSLFAQGHRHGAGLVSEIIESEATPKRKRRFELFKRGH
jgi:hypothetical protein